MTTLETGMIAEPWYLKFHGLMPFRVREILLVSSPYDAFTLEEDGRLITRLFMEYSELNLSQAPRITHAPTAARAMEMMERRGFDLVITMVHLADMDVLSFSRRVKERFANCPVVLLTFLEAELQHIEAEERGDGIDRVFLWTGDAGILIAMIKSVEDARNVAHDTAAGVRVILVVEDSVRRYSSFLSLLYSELLAHAGSLIAEGVNPIHKLIRLRARPKILLATTYEEALGIYNRYQRFVTGMISDVRFPRDGVMSGEAGFDLAQAIREHNPDLPILLQSAEPGLTARAEALHVASAIKSSSQLVKRVRQFLAEGMGFGDFIFRLPDRSQVARVRDMYEMEKALPTVPAESVRFHAERNHFALWILARSMFRLGERLRRARVDDFESVEALRQYLVSVLQEVRQRHQQGRITDFSSRTESPGRFVRMGKGSVGGKGRGVAFANAVLDQRDMASQFEGLEIRIPPTVVIGTDIFEQFVSDTGVSEGIESLPDEEILSRFLNNDLPDELKRDLEVACREMDGPLAVRSSSLLEDSHYQPFAGVYATYMLPQSRWDVRMRELFRAIKAVYASTYCAAARSYISNTPYAVDEEKMGVVIQQIVGQRYGERFYPHFSGVARSYNYYPIGDQQPTDGIAAVVLGLGHMVAAGGAALQFSPATPHILPQFPRAADFLRCSQSQFYAVDLTKTTVDFSSQESSLRVCSLADAEQDDTLNVVGSVYSTDEDTIRENLSLSYPRVVTFNNILKWRAIPLAEALAELLQVMRQGVGHAVEIEFAVDMGDWGRSTSSGSKPCLYVLQVRPEVGRLLRKIPELEQIAIDRILCRAERSLGHGEIDDIHDVVYVQAEQLDEVTTRGAVPHLKEINDRLKAAQRPYLLIGPGRWGSTDPRLGIPVEWAQISGAQVVVETAFDGQAVEPSQGSHFFHNIIAMGVGYLTVSVPATGGRSRESLLERDWLDAQPAVTERPAVRHVRFDKPAVTILDGRRGKGVVLKPGRARRTER